MSRTYYQILYVHADAPHEIIRASYRTLMQRLNAHPDRGGDSGEAALINRAYAVLSDETKRREYDRQLKGLDSSVTAERAQTRSETIRPTVGAICPFCTSVHPHQEHIPFGAICGYCESPLTLAGQDFTDQTGLRKFQRIARRSKLSVYSRWPQKRPSYGITADISPRGMMFEISTEISVGSILKIDCSRFKAIAHVVNCREAGKFLRPNWKVGVQFVTLQFRSSRGTFLSDSA